MAVMVRIQNRKAIFRHGAWICSDPAMEKNLNLALESWIEQTGGPPLGDRDPEHTAAQVVTGQMGGRILAHVPSNLKRSRAFFFERRQIRLPF
jgi:hypothetical protein